MYEVVTKDFDALTARLPRDWGAGFSEVGAALCDDGRRAEVESFFKERAPRFTGGPRTLAQSLESMHLCSVYRSSQTPKVKAFFAGKK